MKDLPIAALLSPLLFAQGRWVRATIPDLPEAQGVRSGSFGNVKSGSVDSDLSILILGDSAAAGVGVVDQKQALSGQLVHQLAQAMDNKASTRVDWTLIAKKGATTANVLSWVPTLERRVYDVIVVSLGVNDVTGGVTKKQWLKQQKVLVAELTSRFSPIQIILSKVPPMGTAVPQ
ncbi:hypothetical protein A9Q99_10570 [Gammaproteobacteria bacterium 45_16_T64]|nr:hypothetical protein A9Q99_10570 [Gammaproteobacteria bacterium 45_16_T64]